MINLGPQTQVLIQGMTGKEGARMARWMLASGTRVMAGVTPGKTGQEIEGRPIFDQVAEAKKRFPELSVSSVAVPAAHVLPAVREAFEAGISLVHVLSERLPVHDVMQMIALADQHQAQLLGPSSVGYLQFPRFRLGYLGGQQPFARMTEGRTALLSMSGGMANELMMALVRQGIGIRLAMALGGDRLVGFPLDQAIKMAEARPDVDRLLLFIEPGNPILAAVVSGQLRPKKPWLIFLAGDCLDVLPKGLPYGHAGTLLGEDELSVAGWRDRLHQCGVPCVNSMQDFVIQTKLLCQT